MFKFSLKLNFVSVLSLALLASCANNGSDVEIKEEPPMIHHQAQNEVKVLADFELYQLALKSLKLDQDDFAAAFLTSQGRFHNSMTETIRFNWLSSLGKREEWGLFAQEYKKLPADFRNQEITCYAAISNYAKDQKSLKTLSQQLVRSNEKLSYGCNRMVEFAASKGLIAEKDGWKRVRILLSNNQIKLASSLASALGQPLNFSKNTGTTKADKTVFIAAAITPKGRNRTDIDRLAVNLAAKVDKEDIEFTRGIIGLSKARDLEMNQALAYFEKADRNQFSNEQWQWYARSALRLRQWGKLTAIIAAMPEDIQQTPTWQYWQARSKNVLGDKKTATALYEKVAASGRNFYAILAHEELSRPLNVVNNVAPSSMSAVAKIAENPQLQRALILFRASLQNNNREMRTAAQQQWRFAIRGYDEDALLAAAQLAYQNQFYEMAILSADSTDEKLNYNLRFLSPYKEVVDKYTQQYPIDSAWVFGLIRQESRFMTAAQSVVGASGLMQIMPGTAKLIAKKTNLASYNVNDMNDNIYMGVWYLADLYNEFGSEPLATSAYNAGPNRARRWRQSGLEGAIYAETIPFNETRDYVKKVMSNTIYYSHLFKENNRSLKSRLGIID